MNRMKKRKDVWHTFEVCHTLGKHFALCVLCTSVLSVSRGVSLNRLFVSNHTATHSTQRYRAHIVEPPSFLTSN